MKNSTSGAKVTIQKVRLHSQMNFLSIGLKGRRL
jgi:hypothetical protein